MTFSGNEPPPAFSVIPFIFNAKEGAELFFQDCVTPCKPAAIARETQLPQMRAKPPLQGGGHVPILHFKQGLMPIQRGTARDFMD